MKLKKLKKRVDRGVKLLDKKKPKWWKKVDLKKLDLNSEDNCVLGQIYGSYTDGCGKLNLNFGIKHGFANPHDFKEPDFMKFCDKIDAYIDQLKKVWKKRIKQKLGECNA